MPNKKTSWRIQEAQNVFALMREEYENSKNLNVFRRYRELERIVEMFTADPILEKLRYLCTDESEVRHKKAVQTSMLTKFTEKTPARSSYYLGHGSGANVTHKSNHLPSNKSPQKDGMKSNKALNDNKNSPNNTVNSIFSTEKTVEKDRNGTTLKPYTSVSNVHLGHQGDVSKDSLKPPPAIHRKRAKSLGILTETLGHEGTTNLLTRSVENIGQACSTAYNLVAEKVSSVTEFTGHNLKLSTPMLRPMQLSVGSFLSRTGKRYRRRQSSLANAATLRAFYFPDTNTTSASESAVHAKTPITTQQHPVTKQNHFGQDRAKVAGFKQEFTSAHQGRSKNTALDTAAGSKSINPSTSMLTSPAPSSSILGSALEKFRLKSKSSAMGKHAEKTCSSRNPSRSSRIHAPLQNSRRGFTVDTQCCFSGNGAKAQRSNGTKSVSNCSGTRPGGNMARASSETAPIHVDDCCNTDDAIVDSIVLTLAYDHIASLKSHIKQLQGLNKLRRYRKMKVIIKLCMNNLKPEQN